MAQNSDLFDFFPKQGEFVVELEFTDHNKETASKLLSSVTRGTELLPGLKVKKLHCPAHSVAQKGSEDLLEGVAEAFEEFKAKVNSLLNEDWAKRSADPTSTPEGSVKVYQNPLEAKKKLLEEQQQ